MVDADDVLWVESHPVGAKTGARFPWKGWQPKVVFHGARHASFRDGVWTQLEPLLWRGAAQGIERPGWLTGVYARGDTNRLQDRSGETPAHFFAAEALLTGVSMAAGTVSAVINGYAGNEAAAAADWAGVALDGATIPVGGLPGVSGGVRAAGNVVEVISKFGDEAVAGVKAAVGALGEAGSKLIDDVAGASKGAGSKVETAADMIKQSGAEVNLNPKGATQEGKVTLDFGDGNRVNLRVETHPLEKGGDPVRHANVEVVETVNGKSKVTENTHIVEEE